MRSVRMNLIPLSGVASDSAAASIRIACCKCGTVAQYMDAATTAAGWKFDLQGAPFKAYYCPQCAHDEGNPA